MRRQDLRAVAVLIITLCSCGTQAASSSDPSQPPPTVIAPANSVDPSQPQSPNVSEPTSIAAVTTTAPSTAATWQIDAAIEVSVQIPPDWSLDPYLNPLSETDTANGLFLLQRWIVPNSPGTTALSVQRDPGDDAPVNTTPSCGVIEIEVASWRLVEFGNGDCQSVVAFARINGYLFEITGTDTTVETLAASVIVSPLPPN